MLPVILVHLWCIPNRLVLRKDTDIIHVAMGGQKSFHTCWGGFKKFWRVAKGVKIVWRQKFSIAQPPNQSIYEHSLDCSKMARRINTGLIPKRNPYLINSYFFSKLVREKNSIGWAKYVYVCEWDMCWRNFCNFPWWLKNVKRRSKIALFSNERHFEIWFQKVFKK